jgi:hypothetical protein
MANTDCTQRPGGAFTSPVSQRFAGPLTSEPPRLSASDRKQTNTPTTERPPTHRHTLLCCAQWERHAHTTHLCAAVAQHSASTIRGVSFRLSRPRIGKNAHSCPRKLELHQHAHRYEFVSTAGMRGRTYREQECALAHTLADPAGRCAAQHVSRRARALCPQLWRDVG